jgi:iron(III) transport system ATP-binding protein
LAQEGNGRVAFINIQALRKRFGAHAAVDGVSLSVEEGHTLALLGPSGCGKTTILRCIAGLETAQEGRIEIAGQTVFDGAAKVNLMPEQRQLGIVFQSYAVWPHMTVAENVGFPLKVRGVAAAERTEKVERVLKLVGLAEQSAKSATQLSGGQQQRVALARALVHEPRLVLFDEPMSNLDAQLREHMRMELMVLQARLKFTAIYVTHDQAEAFALAETVVVMNKGRIETMGAPREVAARPKSPFVARFLGYNVVDGRVVGQVTGGNGRSYVQVSIGEDAVLLATAGDDAALEPGAPALVCVRKEHVLLSPAAPGTAGHGSIQAASFLGLQEEYSVHVGGAELRAIQASSGGLKTGDATNVQIDADQCIVFSNPSS